MDGWMDGWGWMGTLIRDELSTTARPDPSMKRGAQSSSPPPQLLPSFLYSFWWTRRPGLISCLLHMLIGCLSGARHRGRRDLSDSPPPLPSRRQVLPFLAELGNRHSSSNVVGGGRGAHSPPPPPPLHKRPSSALRSPRHSTVPDIVITRRRNSAYETIERDNGPPNGKDVRERRNSGGGLRRLDNWIQHLMHEGVSKKDQRANEWKYADDVKVTIAPIAQSEVDEQPRYSRDTTRASTVLQNLREQADHIELNEKRRQQVNNHNQPIGLIQSHPSPLPEHPDMNRSLQIPRATPTLQSGRLSAEPQSSKRDWEHDMNVIFLQANEEVKRVVLPPRIDAMEQIKMAFVRVFPHITRGYIEQPFVKIYIQDSVKGLFYELDDLREVRHKTVLRLREQRANGVASPVRHLDHPDYHSEAEFDDANRHRFVSLARPASAMARARDPYYDSYSSDASDSRANSVTRSGSATPIIDKEARDRMETMERQLAGLSSLVHTALVSKGMPESAQRDMADLRRQILALHPDTDRLPNESPAPASELSTSPSNRGDLVALRERIHATGTDCRQLRSTAQANAQEAQNMLQEASLEITRMVSQQIAGSTHPVMRRSQTPQIQTKDDVKEGRMRDEHETRTRALIDTLATFEQNVESLRTSVLNANRKLKMSEVEQLTEQLTQIGRTAASIKTDFPSLQSKIETRIKQDMERVVRDEKYIREETQAVDQSLRRCKALANIMVTMKKLAMVQDPSLGRGHHSQRNSKNSNVSLTLPPPVPLASHLPPPPPPPPSAEQIPPPPVPPSPNNYSRQETPQTSTLDSVLDEVQSIPSVPHPPAVSSMMHPSIQTVPTGQPPRPPSRTSVSDVRSKFKQPPELPEQIRSLIEDAKRSSPSLDSQANERTPKTLDERQRELAEKQRQLTSQFHQMQSLPQSQSS